MNNSSSEQPCTFDDCYTEQALIFVPEVQVGFLVLYAIVSVIGTLGNIFILITVIRSHCLLTLTLVLVELLRLSRQTSLI